MKVDHTLFSVYRRRSQFALIHINPGGWSDGQGGAETSRHKNGGSLC